MNFYVTVRDGGRTGYLLGPYPTHDEARTNVDRGRTLAEARDAWAHFYSFGTARVSATTLPRATFGR